MAGGEDKTSGEAVLDAIPLVVASTPEPAKRRFRFTVPRIVDYLIVATFIYFVF